VFLKHTVFEHVKAIL